MKSGFAMISAIMLLVLISTLGMFAMKLSQDNTEKIVTLYLREQTELHTTSAIQMTLLEIANKGYGTECVNEFNTTLDDIYQVEVKVYYIFDSNNSNCRMFDTTSSEQNGTVILDVNVQVTDENILPEKISYSKRVIEKL